MLDVEMLYRIDLDVARMVTREEALDNMILPIFIVDSVLNCLACNCDDMRCSEHLRNIYNKDIKFIYVTAEELLGYIDMVLDYNYSHYEDKILELAIKNRTSDIHFEPMLDKVYIRFRINGYLVIFRIIKLSEFITILSRLKINSNMDMTEKRRPQDGKMNIAIEDRTYSLRLSTIPVVEGEKLVVRIIYEDRLISTLEELNFNDNQLDKLKKIINIKSGIVIINGPTGSGKSTTLYTILNLLKNEPVNITTLEDPIEANILGINQISLNPKIGITFASGLRSILRQDPDIIMIGEIRDIDTAQMAIRAAITGHKVYTTIHSKSPREVFIRLRDMGIEHYLIEDSLKGIISQRLIGVLCDKCKEQLKVSNRIYYKKHGCKSCNYTGYIGRTLVSSVCYIEDKITRNVYGIEDRNEKLSNKEMLSILIKLLNNGKLDYYDYLDFIEWEDLN
ncbi:GspE/PulE family protein [Clostridium sp. MSJ-8]|uniref:GspE/PulE family protein n=1 Tax=Clostridium sp. MSJ-8 TaxID=2841510 RepID=UPI00209FCA8F|nr:GspE/PulE family protein [Clostridium sp. MSJ-8]